MTPKRVVELVALYDDGWSLPALSARYGVSVSTVSRIITGKTWGSVTGGRNRSRAGQTTDYRAAHIATRLEQGCRSHSVIAVELGISRQAVAKLIRTRNLEAKVCA